jgi:hypothetical protein
MMEQLLQDEADATVDEDDKFMILACRLHLHQLNAAPWRGGSRVGKRKNKDMQRMSGALMVEVDNSADLPTHTAKEFLTAV